MRLVHPRQALLGAVVLAAALTNVVISTPATLGPQPAQAASIALPSPAPTRYEVGRGIADITGPVAEVNFAGYADTSQLGDGLHTRQHSRAFVIRDRATGRRVVHVVADIAFILQSLRDAVLERLTSRYGGRYTEQNVMLTATHTHAAPGGFSHHPLYNLPYGFEAQNYRGIVNGIVASIARADADVAPADLAVSTSRVAHGNAQRSRQAFNRNPAGDRRYFPTGTDTTSTTLQVRRGGRLVGAINWFPVHATSMPTNNTLVSADNKGYASYDWEHEVREVDYLADRTPDFISSFAQSNAGDMSPNLDLRPGMGPTKNPFTNSRKLGERMAHGARAGLASARGLTGAIDSRLIYVDMSNFRVRPEFSPDGKPHTTCSAAFGASFAAGSTEDGGGGLPVAFEGKDGGNPAFDVLSEVLYTASPALRECQAPKEILAPVGAVDFVQQKLPVQLVRIGDFYLIGMPTEVTIVAGLRLRRAVAAALRVPLEKVVVQGYANSYSGYVTTPEEYDSQEYEGGHTLYGRNELPAFTQVASGLATAMREGRSVARGAKERDRSDEVYELPPGTPLIDAPAPGRSFGDVVVAPRSSYRRGAVVTVGFVGAHPNNDLRRGDTFLTVDRRVGGRWVRVADDNDFETTFRWARSGVLSSTVTVLWDMPPGTRAGRYRVRYFGAARSFTRQVTPFVGTSEGFIVR